MKGHCPTGPEREADTHSLTRHGVHVAMTFVRLSLRHTPVDDCAVLHAGLCAPLQLAGRPASAQPVG
jgi:hypothetical protein